MLKRNTEYKLYFNGANLCFWAYPALINAAREVCLATNHASYTTGNHLVTGVMDGRSLKLYLDANLMNTTTLNSNYDDYLQYYASGQYFAVGSLSGTAVSTNHWTQTIDELAIWPIDLSATQIASIYQKLMVDRLHLEDWHFTPSPISLAYINFYQNAGNRARLTMLNCNNYPFIYVSNSNVQPASTAPDWIKCNTKVGGILSEPLTPAAPSPVVQKVYVWARDGYGNISSDGVEVEIDHIATSDHLALPTFWWSLDQAQFSSDTNYHYDYMSNRTLYVGGPSFTNKPTLNVPFLAKEGVTFNSASSQYLLAYWIPQMWARTNLTIGAWINKDNLGTGYLFSYGENTNTTADVGYHLYVEGAFLKFAVGVTGTNYLGGALTGEVLALPLTEISSGKHFIAGRYDMPVQEIWIDGVLRARRSINKEQYSTDTKLVDYSFFGSLFIGAYGGAGGTPVAGKYFSGSVDEITFWDYAIDQQQLIHWYERGAQELNLTNDVTPPTTNPTISILRALNGDGSDLANQYSTNNPNPFAQLSSCNDIAGIYIRINDPTAPANSTMPVATSESGWIYCNTLAAGIQFPTLTDGVDSIAYIWLKDAYGNITAAPQTVYLRYDQPAIYTPAAYWSFDAKSITSKMAYDYLGNNVAYLYNSFSSDSTIDNPSGKVNESLNFNGIDQFAYVKSDPSFQPTDELTVAAWVDLDVYTPTQTSGGLDNDLFASTTRTGTDSGWVLDYHCYATYQCFTRFGVLINGTFEYAQVPSQLVVLPALRHVVGTFDGRFIKLYINNTLYYTKDLGSYYPITYNGSSPLYIGALGPASGIRPTTTTEFQDGRIDELIIWNKALLPTQINTLYGLTTNVYLPNRPLDLDLSGKTFTFFDRYGKKVRVTAGAGSCTNLDLVLITDGTVVAPNPNDLEWQLCNELPGGLLSKNFPVNAGQDVKIWGKTFDGSILATTPKVLSGVATIENKTIPRPSAWWTLNDGDFIATPGLDRSYESLNYTANPDFPSMDAYASFSPTPPSSTAGAIHQALLFNGTNNYLKILPVPIFNPSHFITIALWASLTKGDDQTKYLFGNRLSGSSGIALYLSGGKLNFSVENKKLATWTSETYTNTVSIASDRYESGIRHIAASYNGEYFKIYVDGILLLNQRHNESSFWPMNTHQLRTDEGVPWFIAAANGAGGNVGGNYFDNLIDEIKIWPVVLTDQQVFYDFQHGANYRIAGDTTPPDLDIFNPTTFLNLEGPSITNLPFAFFTMSSCLDNSNEAVNALYVTVDSATVPTSEQSGWQYCSNVQGGIRSPLLTDGQHQVVRVYLKDDAGNILGPISHDITYNPPAMPNPFIYYTFDNSAPYLHRLGNYRILDLIGNKHLTGVSSVNNFASTNGLLGDYLTSYNDFYGSARAHNFTANNGVLSFWFYPQLNANPDTIIAGKANHARFLRNNINDLKFELRTATNSYSYTLQGKMIPYQWNHVAFNRNGTDLTIYLNGVRDSSYTVDGSDFYLSNDFFQLRGDHSTTYLDETVLYDQALSPEQIFYLYYLGKKPLPSRIPYHPIKTQLAPIPDLYWSLDNASYSAPTVTAAGTDAPFNLTNSAATSGASGNINQAFSFLYASNSKLTGAGPLDLGTQYTISLWFNRSGTHASNPPVRHTIISQWEDAVTSNKSFEVFFKKDNLLYFGHQDSGNTLTETNLLPAPYNAGISSIGTGTWYHLAITRNGTLMQAYLNGKDSYLGFPLSALSTKINLQAFILGAANVSTSSFQGSIDDVAIFHQALNYDQVYDLYTNTTNQVLIPQLVAHSNTDSTTNSSDVSLSISDCANYDLVYIKINDASKPNGTCSNLAYTTEASCLADTETWTPFAGSWLSCSSALAAYNVTLPSVGNNDVYFWFKHTGDGDDAVTFMASTAVNYVLADVSAPTEPTITALNVSPVAHPFIEFRFDSCETDELIDGYYIGNSALTPSGQGDGWQSCTAAPNTITYTLKPGDQNLSIWFKDRTGNVTSPSGQAQFHYQFNPPALGTPTFYLNFDTSTQNQIYVEETISHKFFQCDDNNTSKYYSANASQSVVNQSFGVKNYNYLTSLGLDPHFGAQMSFSTWVRMATPFMEVKLLSKWDGSAAGSEWQVGINTLGRICLYYHTTGGNSWTTTSFYYACSTGAISWLTWQQVAVVRDGTDVKFYIDGRPSGNATINGNDFYNTSSSIPLTIGNNSQDTRFDEFAAWASALTDAQVATLYAQGKYLLPISTQPLPQAAPNPDHYWDFDNTSFSDPTLNGLTGTIGLVRVATKEPTAGSSGKVNQSFDFNESHLLEADNATFDLGTSATLAMWYYPTDDSVLETDRILRKWDTGTEEFQLSFLSSRKIEFSYKLAADNASYGDLGFTQITSNTMLSYNTWYHIAIVKDQDLIILYLNGAIDKIKLTNTSNFLNQTTQPFRIGGISDIATTEFLSGRLDELAIWKNQALTMNNVQYLYQQASVNLLPLPYQPQLSLAEESTTVANATRFAHLTISSCQNGATTYTHVKIITTVSGIPDNVAWAPCLTTIGNYLTGTLDQGAVNSVQAIFSTDGSNQSGDAYHTNDVDINYVDTN